LYDRFHKIAQDQFAQVICARLLRYDTTSTIRTDLRSASNTFGPPFSNGRIQDGATSPIDFDAAQFSVFVTSFPLVPLRDCSRDGLLNTLDLACVNTISSRDAVLEALNTLPGDLGGDGEVAFIDFLTMVNNFGKNLATYAEGNIDLNDDGVACGDFLELSKNFGKTPGDVAAVPEPNAVGMLWLGLLSVIGLRRDHTIRLLISTPRRPTSSD